MPSRCTVCDHPERKALDAALVEGQPYRPLAVAYGVSRDALWRHGKTHLSGRLVAAQARKAQREDEALVDRLERLYDKAEDVLDAAMAEGRPYLTLTAIRELRGVIELLGRFLGQLTGDGPAVEVNILAVPEWLAVRRAIVEALAPYPEARAAVVAALGRLGGAPAAGPAPPPPALRHLDGQTADAG